MSDNNLPIGTIIAWIGPLGNLPRGWLLCRGVPVDRNAYPRLYALLLSTEMSDKPGVGVVTPDLRGYFLRCAGEETSSERHNPFTGAQVGDVVLSVQKAAVGSHTHNYNRTTIQNTGSEFLLPNRMQEGNNLGLWNKGNETQPNVSDGDTRPRNVAVHYIIKAD